jgi:probable addiction module antidote protein
VIEFEPCVYLDSEDAIAEYLSAALEEDDAGLFIAAVGHVAKVRGMSAIAQAPGLLRISDGSRKCRC